MKLAHPNKPGKVITVTDNSREANQKLLDGWYPVCKHAESRPPIAHKLHHYLKQAEESIAFLRKHLHKSRQENEQLYHIARLIARHKERIEGATGFNGAESESRED